MAAGSPPRKVDALLEAMAAGQWPRAIRIAAKWPKLGEQKQAIMTAAAALLSPGFYVSLGKDPETLVIEGIAALKARYGHMQTPKEAPMSKQAAKAETLPSIGLRKYVLEAKGATKAQLAALASELLALQNAVAACTSKAKAEALRAKIFAMPTATPLEKAWRMQHIDTLNRHCRALWPAQERAAPKAKRSA